MMKKQVISAIDRFSLLERGENITVALSGGADSMALLYVLLELRKNLGITVSAAHLNHQIRGDEALRDESFVKEQCEKLGVPLFIERAEVLKLAKEQNLSVELAARKLRYEFLERVNTGKVATAHTASDNLETVIFNITRGSGLGGVCGIPAKRDIFIRPLIFCTRQDIENYCEANNIPYITDSTNLTDDYARNKIRHNVIPVLKELNPSVEETVLRMSLNATEDLEFIEGMAEEYLSKYANNNSFALNDFEKLNPAVAKRVIKLFIDKCNKEISPEAIHIENAYNKALLGGKTSLPKNYSAVCENGEFWVIKNGEPQIVPKFSVSITGYEKEDFEKFKKINNLLLNNCFDYDKIVGKLELRTRKTGDSIRLKNRGCTKTLNQIFNENKTPVAFRDKIPVLADEKGVVWVCGSGVAQRVCINSCSKKIGYIKAFEEKLNG
ncbi:MAG: tRNA lysidine(34) synthetase TilS [Clostridia bacterium]|nr:tRNA lysidine(34) synthetase TilS [Clostridia bacterium]